MTHSPRIDPQGPARAVALEPIGSRLDSSTSKQIVALAPFIQILIECRQHYTGAELDLDTIRICAGIAVRDAKDVAEKAVEIGVNLLRRDGRRHVLPNRSRLSCGALKKDSFPNLRAPPAPSNGSAKRVGCSAKRFRIVPSPKYVGRALAWPSHITYTPTAPIRLGSECSSSRRNSALITRTRSSQARQLQAHVRQSRR